MDEMNQAVAQKTVEEVVKNGNMDLKEKLIVAGFLVGSFALGAVVIGPVKKLVNKIKENVKTKKMVDAVSAEEEANKTEEK